MHQPDADDDIEAGEFVDIRFVGYRDGKHILCPAFDKGVRYSCQSAEPLTLQVAILEKKEIRLDIEEIPEDLRMNATYREGAYRCAPTNGI